MLVFGKDGDGFLVKEDLAAAFADLADAEKVVQEGGHNLAVSGVKGGQVEVGGRGGSVDAVRDVANMGCGIVRIYVADGEDWSDVYVTGARVVNVCVRDGNTRRGRATARKIS